MARGLPASITPTLTSTFNTVGGSGCFFYREGLQASPQPARSAMDRDTGIPEGRSLATPKRQEAKTVETEGTELWNAEVQYSIIIK